jgi:ribosome-binding protein aMBF1 (putative translation factor)
MIVYKCDLCGEIRDCAQRAIEQTEYDICSECWNELMAKVKGKGRAKKTPSSPIALPPAIGYETSSEPRPRFPGEPPEIIADGRHPN